MAAWNGWYHVNGNTYGTWLPGDPRGWRSRHHREHVHGDYKNLPPPGMYDGLRTKAAENMKRNAVFLREDERRLVGKAMVELLLHKGVELLSFSLDAVHFHLLGRFGKLRIRPTVGQAKKHSTYVLKARSFEGGIWARICDPRPIRNREHQVTAYQYILDHVKKGAWIWNHKEGVCWDTTLSV